MHRIVNVVPERDFVLRVEFDSRESGLFDAEPYLDGPIYEPLRDRDYFVHVRIDEIAGTICWPNGADFCPDVVYRDAIQERPVPADKTVPPAR